jgi:SAM-dependent methyltransferase
MADTVRGEIMELLIGCGNNRKKQITFDGISEEWSKDLITLDWDDYCNPDVLHDLNQLPYPFDDSMFDEIHAYETLEHIGRQGDYRAFFNQFSELHRILKPGGWLIGSCPNWDSVWAWSDPGHTRLITPQMLSFLSQSEYDKQVGSTAFTDYRFCYEADFEMWAFQEEEHNFGFILRAIKDEYKPADNR